MISVYTDGSSMGCSNEPGGWSYVIVRDGETLADGYGGHPSTTNNRMELTGAIEGLSKAVQFAADGEEIELVSDSQYTLGMASGGYKPKKNLDLATALRRLAIKVKAKTRWVKGHNKDAFNEQCDVLAKTGKEECSVRG